MCDTRCLATFLQVAIASGKNSSKSTVCRTTVVCCGFWSGSVRQIDVDHSVEERGNDAVLSAGRALERWRTLDEPRSLLEVLRLGACLDESPIERPSTSSTQRQALQLLKGLTTKPRTPTSIRHVSVAVLTCLASGTPGDANAVLPLFPLSPGRVRLELRLFESCHERSMPER